MGVEFVCGEAIEIKSSTSDKEVTVQKLGERSYLKAPAIVNAGGCWAGKIAEMAVGCLEYFTKLRKLHLNHIS